VALHSIVYVIGKRPTAADIANKSRRQILVAIDKENCTDIKGKRKQENSIPFSRPRAIYLTLHFPRTYLTCLKGYFYLTSCRFFVVNAETSESGDERALVLEHVKADALKLVGEPERRI
jgi:hypothetical protein